VAQLEEGHNFTRKSFGSLESLRVEHDSRDHFLIRFGHSHLSEKLFQIIGQV
jgi:hypothetical protein